MIDKVVNVLTNPSLLRVSQNTVTSVSIETGLKAVGRPTATLMDKHADKKTREYSAVKELFYQLLCLGIYLSMIPFFKRGGFALCKKIFKNEISMQNFKNSTEYLNYHKLACLPKSERISHELMSKIPDREIQVGLKHKNSMRNELLNKEKPFKFPMAKGVIELSSIVGSVLGLTILAPEISHLFLHPLMKLVGMENKQKNVEQKVDTKA